MFSLRGLMGFNHSFHGTIVLIVAVNSTVLEQKVSFHVSKFP